MRAIRVQSLLEPCLPLSRDDRDADGKCRRSRDQHRQQQQQQYRYPSRIVNALAVCLLLLSGCSFSYVRNFVAVTAGICILFLSPSPSSSTLSTFSPLTDIFPSSSSPLFLSSLAPSSWIVFANGLEFTLGLTAATLLSGGLTDCTANVNASTCKGGIASFMAHGRNLTRSAADTSGTHNQHSLFILPVLDVSTPFVQMHPHGQSVNLDVLRHATATSIDKGDDEGGIIGHYLARPSFFTQTMDFTRFFSAAAVGEMFPIAANFDVPAGYRWRNHLRTFATRVLADGVTRVGITHSLQTDQRWVSDPIAGLQAVIQDMRAAGCDVVILLSNDVFYSHDVLLPLLSPHLPDVFIDTSGSVVTSQLDSFSVAAAPSSSGTASPTTASTVLVGAIPLGTTGTFLSLSIDNVTKSITKNALLTPDITTATIPATLRDAEYYEMQSFLRQSALQASTNDPMLATALEGASKSRSGGSYPCYAGECAQATLYTKAYRWRYDTDIAFTNSGGVRGPGWAAGQSLRTSDIWALMTFPNYPCTGTILGLKLWELANHSLHHCMFSDAFSTSASAFLQMAGVEIDYDRSALSVEMHTRVRAVRVLDRATNTYKPLERLRVYTFSTDTYQCTLADVAPFLKPKYDGETLVATAGDELIQTTMQEFLKANDPYGPSLVGYFKERPVADDSNDGDDGTTNTNSTSGGGSGDAAHPHKGFMIWTQVPSDCSSAEHYVDGLGTCMPCGAGLQRDALDFRKCVPIPTAPLALLVGDDSGATTIIAVVVPIVVAAFVILLVVVAIVFFRTAAAQQEQVRDTRYAPKGDKAAIIFTDVQMSTKLWGTVPASMGYALDQHHALIRAAIAAHGGYEVKTVGDSFMIAIESAQSAVDLAQQIQLVFQSAAWPRCINQVYAAESNHLLLDAIDDEPSDLSTVGVAISENAGGGEGDCCIAVDDDVIAFGAMSPLGTGNGGDGKSFPTIIGGGGGGDSSGDEAVLSPVPINATQQQQQIHHPSSSNYRQQQQPQQKNVDIHHPPTHQLTNNDNNHPSPPSPFIAIPAPCVSHHFNGLRVRIGIHYGPVESVFDEVAKGYDYYGNTVNIAARIEAAGDGGQIIVSREVANRVAADDEKFRIELLGAAQLNGVVGPTELLQVTPVALAGRVYSAKAMDRVLARSHNHNHNHRGGGDYGNADDAENEDAQKENSAVFYGSGSHGVGDRCAERGGGDRRSRGSNTSRVSVSMLSQVPSNLIAGGGSIHGGVVGGGGGGGGGGGQLDSDGLPILNEKESIVKDILIRFLKPMKVDARRKHIEAIGQSWHVRLPGAAFKKKLLLLPDDGKGRGGGGDQQQHAVLSIIAQRIGAVVQLTAPSSSSAQQNTHHHQHHQQATNSNYAPSEAPPSSHRNGAMATGRPRRILGGGATATTTNAHHRHSGGGGDALGVVAATSNFVHSQSSSFVGTTARGGCGGGAVADANDTTTINDATTSIMDRPPRGDAQQRPAADASSSVAGGDGDAAVVTRVTSTAFSFNANDTSSGAEDGGADPNFVNGMRSDGMRSGGGSSSGILLANRTYSSSSRRINQNDSHHHHHHHAGAGAVVVIVNDEEGVGCGGSDVGDDSCPLPRRAASAVRILAEGNT